MTKLLEQFTLERFKLIAHDKGLILNTDSVRIEKIVKLMTINKMITGFYYCPCKQKNTPPTKEDILCPCEELPREIAAYGHCRCRVFYTKEPE